MKGYQAKYPHLQTPQARQERAALAADLTSGERDAAGLTAKERALLAAIRRDGWTVIAADGWPRYIEKAA